MSNTMNNDDLKKIGMIIGGIGIVIIIIFLALMYRSEKFESPNRYLMELRMKKCYSLNDVDAILNLVPGTYEMIENGKVQPDSETKERLRKLLAKCDDKDVDMIVSSLMDGPSGMQGQGIQGMIKGPTGPGPMGMQGQGMQGMIKGPTGPGPMGMQGMQGVQGIQGMIKGPTGPGPMGMQGMTKEFYESNANQNISVDVKYEAEPYVDKDIIVTSAILEFEKNNEKFKLVIKIKSNGLDNTINYSGFYSKTREDNIYLFNMSNYKIGFFDEKLKITFDNTNKTGLPEDIFRIIQKLTFKIKK